MFKRLLVPLDGTPLSEKALHYAVKISAPESHIILMIVAEIPLRQTGYAADGLPPPLFTPDILEKINAETAQVREKLEVYLQKTAQALLQTGRHVEAVISTGLPEQEILAAADKLHPDVIVMATHTKGGWRRWFVGSVTQRVLNASPVAVMVVPAAPRE